MYYRTKDHKLVNLNSFDRLMFHPNVKEGSSRIKASAQFAEAPQVGIDVKYDLLSMVGSQQNLKRKLFTWSSDTHTEVIRDDMNPITLLLDSVVMAQMGILPITSIHIEPDGVFPHMNTSEEWYTSRGVDKNKSVDEDSIENQLRKAPVFTASITLWVSTFDGTDTSFPVSVRNAPLGYVTQLLNRSRITEVMPAGAIASTLTLEGLKNVLPEGSIWTHYMQEEALRLTQTTQKKSR